MLLRNPRHQRSRAAAAVETAFVMIPVMIFFTGVVEYGRYLMDRQLVNNAAREACRWAITNNTSGTNAQVQSNVYNLVTQYMAGQQNTDFAGWTSSSVTCTVRTTAAA